LRENDPPDRADDGWLYPLALTRSNRRRRAFPNDPDTVVHRDELLRAVWGYLDTDVITRTVDFAIARLRKKIEVDRHHPAFIRTVHGDGYCLSGVSDEA